MIWKLLTDHNSYFKGFFKDIIEYKELLIGNGFNLITEIKVPQHYNIDVKTLKMNSLDSEHTHNKIVLFNFILKDSKHIIIQSPQNTKTDFIILMWKIIIHKINLNWIRFGFYSWSFIITFIPLVTFFTFTVCDIYCGSTWRITCFFTSN